MSKPRKVKADPTHVVDEAEGPIREELRVPELPETRYVVEDATGTIILEEDESDAAGDTPSSSRVESHLSRWFVGPVLLLTTGVVMVLAVGILLDKVSLEEWKVGGVVVVVIVVVALVSGVGVKVLEAIVRAAVRFMRAWVGRK